MEKGKLGENMPGESDFHKNAMNGVVSEVPGQTFKTEKKERVVVPISEYRVAPKPKKTAKELAAIAVAENNLNRLGVSSRVEKSINFQKDTDHFDEVKRIGDRLEREEVTRKKTMRHRIMLGAAAFGVAAAGLFGLKANAEKSVRLDDNRSQSTRERVLSQATEDDGDQGGVNDNLKEMYENGNELRGLDYISEAPVTETGDVSQAVKDNLEQQREADDKGKEIKDGLDTSTLE